MAKFALVVALIALIVAVMAYQKASPGGVAELKSVERALESMRKETADALSRIERSIRPDEGAPAKPKP